MVTMKCEACGKFLEIPEEYRGQTGKCNACGAALLVPKSSVKPVPKWKMGCLYAFLGCMAFASVGSWLFPNTPEPRATRTAPVRPVTPAPLQIETPPAFSPRELQKIESEVEEILAPKNTITLEKFNQLQTGMSYKQAVSILGEEGEVMSESSFGSGQYTTHTIMYTWKGGGFMANMNAMFQNGQMISKAQLGLK